MHKILYINISRYVCLNTHIAYEIWYGRVILLTMLLNFRHRKHTFYQ